MYSLIMILELNITNITTSTSIYYLLSDIIISNEIYINKCYQNIQTYQL